MSANVESSPGSTLIVCSINKTRERSSTWVLQACDFILEGCFPASLDTINRREGVVFDRSTMFVETSFLLPPIYIFCRQLVKTIAFCFLFVATISFLKY